MRDRILIVDDEVNARTALAELLRDEGYAVETAADGFKALPKLAEFAPALLLTDLKMPGMDGIELMKKTRASDPDCVIVVMTAYGAVDTAVKAMKEGAADYLTKPVNVEELVMVLARELERRRLRAEAGQLRERLQARHRVSNIVGTSPEMQRVFDALLQVAPSRASVLITGESGTGKELIAAAIHEHHPRKLLAYNCSPSFNWKKALSDEEIAGFQQQLGGWGYRFQFITLAGFHSLNAGMFELAQGYRDRGMSAYVELQEREFAMEADGYTATRHQREVGAGYFDKVMQAVSKDSSTLALLGSTEEEQFA